MPEINGKQWTKEEVHAALKAGRVEEIWPGATFTDHGDYGEIAFADGEFPVGIRFEGPFKEGEIPVENLKKGSKKK